MKPKAFGSVFLAVHKQESGVSSAREIRDIVVGSRAFYWRLKNDARNRAVVQ
jgi:hypothetical protein